MKYLASALSDKPEFDFRERLFTPWMGPDVLQAHTDHMVELGMLPLYSEYEPELGFREIYWTPETKTYFEVRSACDLEAFREIVDRNLSQGHVLITLQISSDHLYTSTWLESDVSDSAVAILKALGITQAMIQS
ncbi:MAG: hypothetical protein AAGA96_03540 [Verrucomicrobiota bacterium]